MEEAKAVIRAHLMASDGFDNRMKFPLKWNGPSEVLLAAVEACLGPKGHWRTRRKRRALYEAYRGQKGDPKGWFGE